MNKTKTSLIAATVLSIAFFIPQINAQENDGPGPRGDRPHRQEMARKHIAKELGLSADQQSQIKAINESYRPQLDALRDNDSLTPEQKRAQVHALNQERQAKVDALLTPEQQAKAGELRAKMQERKGDGPGKKRRGAGHGPGRGPGEGPGGN